MGCYHDGYSLRDQYPHQDVDDNANAFLWEKSAVESQNSKLRYVDAAKVENRDSNEIFAPQ